MTEAKTGGPLDLPTSEDPRLEEQCGPACRGMLSDMLGRIGFATSNQEREYLGQILGREGRVSVSSLTWHEAYAAIEALRKRRGVPRATTDGPGWGR